MERTQHPRTHAPLRYFTLNAVSNHQRVSNVNELALFAGAGGGILGGILNGWKTVCAVEIDEYCRRILMQRQDDGIIEPFPIWPDVKTFDGKPWAGCVDIVTGGFPCQDISIAGTRKGIAGKRSGLWKQMARIISEVRPTYVLVENSPMLALRGLGTVLGDLAEMGFDAEWGCISAAESGAHHKRDRMWILAYANRDRELQPQGRQQDQHQRGWLGYSSCENVANSHDHGLQGMVTASQPGGNERPSGLRSGKRVFPAWPNDPAETPESGVGRVVDGMAYRMDRLKAIGNGQVPRVAAIAYTTLLKQP